MGSKLRERLIYLFVVNTRIKFGFSCRAMKSIVYQSLFQAFVASIVLFLSINLVASTKSKRRQLVCDCCKIRLYIPNLIVFSCKVILTYNNVAI